MVFSISQKICESFMKPVIQNDLVMAEIDLLRLHMIYDCNNIR